MIWTLILLVALIPVAVVFWEIRKKNLLTWLGSYLKQDWRPSGEVKGPRHVMFCFVDHYEPQWLKPSYEVEVQRVARWRQDYPRLCAKHRDCRRGDNEGERDEPTGTEETCAHEAPRDRGWTVA